MKNTQETWRFFVQVAFSSIVLTFCLHKLAVADQQDNYQALYWGGVTGIMAWWMPSPGNGNSAQSNSQTEQNRVLPPATAKANGKPPLPASTSGNTNVQPLPQRSA